MKKKKIGGAKHKVIQEQQIREEEGANGRKAGGEKYEGIEQPARLINTTEAPKDGGDTSSLTVQEKKEAFKLLKSKNLLYQIGKDIQRAGVAGEKRNGLIVYLCVSSRKLKRPISLLIKGESSAGKNHLLRTTIQFFPEDAYIELTGMSKQALIYSDKSFSHKAILICEKEGMDKALYNIRALQSEGKLVFETVQQLRTERIEKEGPVSFIVTTTSPVIHIENETRNFSIYMDETDEQTKHVKDKIAEGYLDVHTDLSFIKTYQNAQRLLKYYPVTIPYAKFLSKRTPNRPLRMRRDFERLLAGIEVITLLHQLQREIKEQNGIQYLEATLNDYYMGVALLGPTFEESLSETNQKTKAIVDAVFSLYEKNSQPVTLKDLKERLSLSRDTIETWIRPAIESGEIEVRGSKGRVPKTYTPWEKRDMTYGKGLPILKDLAEAFPALAIDFNVINPIDGRRVGVLDEEWNRTITL